MKTWLVLQMLVVAACQGQSDNFPLVLRDEIHLVARAVAYDAPSHAVRLAQDNAETIILRRSTLDGNSGVPKYVAAIYEYSDKPLPESAIVGKSNFEWVLHRPKGNETYPCSNLTKFQQMEDSGRPSRFVRTKLGKDDEIPKLDELSCFYVVRVTTPPPRRR
jgi:hypothetical protein